MPKLKLKLTKNKFNKIFRYKDLLGKKIFYKLDKKGNYIKISDDKYILYEKQYWHYKRSVKNFVWNEEKKRKKKEWKTKKNKKKKINKKIFNLIKFTKIKNKKIKKLIKLKKIFIRKKKIEKIKNFLFY